MSLLALYPEAQREAFAAARLRPAPGVDPGFAARYRADIDDWLASKFTFAESFNRSMFIAPYLDAFEEKTGESLPNPESQRADQREYFYGVVRRRFEEIGKARPELGLKFPGEEEIDAAAVETARAARATAESQRERSTTTGSAVGGFLGAATGAMLDPVNIASMFIAASPSAGLLATFLREAAIVGGSQAVISGSTAGFQRRVDPRFGAADIALEVGTAAVMGGFIGGGIKGLARAWSSFRGQAPRRIKDAASVVEREAFAASAPQRGAEAANVHAETVAQVQRDLFAEKPVQPSADAQRLAGTRAGRVFDSGGGAHDVHYEVVEAGSLVTSHRDDFSAAPEFPAELQPRFRDRIASQEQIHRMASRLVPERLGPSSDAATGAPIVGPGGIVESGNARVMALRRAYARDFVSAGEYRRFLEQQGFNTEGIEQPVLIARRVSELDDVARRRFVDAANAPVAARLSDVEQALADARLLDAALLGQLDGDPTVNRAFLRGFAEKLAPEDRAGIFDAAGMLSQQGERRVRAALLARAYGDVPLLDRILEDADSNIRAIGGALGDAAPAWARMRDAAMAGEIPPTMDITPSVIEAARLIMRARDEGTPLKTLLNQGEMLGGPGDLARMLVRFLFKDADMRRPASRQSVAGMLSDYAAEARKNVSGERLFGEALPSADVLNSALERAGRQDLFVAAEAAVSREAAATSAQAPEVEDAILQEAYRRIEADPGLTLKSFEMNEQGVEIVTEHRLLDVLEEADAEIAAAREIESCATGSVGEAAG